MSEAFPRRFGNYLLTAPLGEDALGRVYRAIRVSGERAFFRLRVMEGPEISEDPLLDAIEENGEIHGLLKNPAITRGVTMDAADGVPFLAFQEDNGRTLDHLLDRARASPHVVPYEHALLIAEKIATALEHAHNTTVDGERTLHGLTWPGFVALSDDGETRLTGFGLAAGFFPSFSRPRFAREVAPYIAAEERANLRIGSNSDVYSVGAILFALLMGRPPNTADPLLDLKTARREKTPLAPEVASLLRMCLAPAESRYPSVGELRRELGKLLFSGPYAPSTFNLAFFLNGLFSVQIEAETNARLREARLEVAGDPMPPPRSPSPSPPVKAASNVPSARDRTPSPSRASPPSHPLPATRDRTPAAGTFSDPLPPLEPPHRSRRPPDEPVASPPRRASLYLGGGLLVAAAVAGSFYLLFRRAPPPPRPASVPTAIPATATPAPPPTPATATAAMTDTQFKDEVARRVAQELKKMETEMRRGAPPPAPAAEARKGPETPVVATRVPAAELVPIPPSPAPSVAPPREESPPPTAPAGRPTPAEVPTEPPAGAVAPAPASVPEVAEAEIAPKIQRVVRPVYPAAALRARIGGVVLLRVLVDEVGAPAEVQVVKGVAGGLTESAVAAVKTWRFIAASHNGISTRAWTTVPIPFEP